MYHIHSQPRPNLVPEFPDFHFLGLDPWKKLLEEGLREDGFFWDWTTLGILGQQVGDFKRGKTKAKNHRVNAKIIAKSKGVWAADGLVRLLQSCPFLKIRSRIQDGQIFEPKSCLIEMSGSSRDLLALERPFLNLAAYSSGIATATHRLVEIAKKKCPKNTPRVSSTRKILPYYRDLAITAIRAGGGYPHRLSLSSGVLIKENHIEAVGGITRALDGVKGVAPHGLKIEIEVTSIREMKEAVRAKADGILLDNFSPKEVALAVSEVKGLSPRPFIEVSGGLNETNLAEYAIPGVDILSVGSLTHSVQATDLSFLVT